MVVSDSTCIFLRISNFWITTMWPRIFCLRWNCPEKTPLAYYYFILCFLGALLPVNKKNPAFSKPRPRHEGFECSLGCKAWNVAWLYPLPKYTVLKQTGLFTIAGCFPLPYLFSISKYQLCTLPIVGNWHFCKIERKVKGYSLFCQS